MLDLGIRFNLAKKLVYSIVVLHTCGWLHKNIRSSNIFFFPARPPANQSFDNHKKDIGRPYIMGYGLSRPDDVPQLKKRVEVKVQEYSRRERDERGEDRKVPHLSRGHEVDVDTDSKPKINIYQHPDKTANPARRFRHSYDIYSLGLVLLELGLWQNLETFGNESWADGYAFRTYVLNKLVPELWGQCGSIYGEVVKDCLKMSSDIGLEDEEGRRLAWSIAERLDMCNA